MSSQHRQFDPFASWHANQFAVIDVETTGVDPAKDRVVEIAVARFDGADIVETWSTLVDPEIPIPPEATAIHGIRDEDVRGKPCLLDAIEMARQVALDAFPVAYCETFDRAFAGAVTGHEWPVWVDPLIAIRHFDRYERGTGRHKLESACARRGIVISNAHRAAPDAIACGQLLWSLKDKLGDVTVSELIRRQRIRAAEQDAEFQAWKTKQAAE